MSTRFLEGILVALETIYDTPRGKHVISIDQWRREAVETLFDQAQRVAWMYNEQNGMRPILLDWLRGKAMVDVFFEPSTRTSTSFAQGERFLGGIVENVTGVKFSSVSKGESLKDTVRAFNCYSDLLVMRHTKAGALAEAAEVSRTPVINAGDGTGEHPTQALLDGFTMKQRFGGLDGLHIGFVGDLVNGRTVHSLARLMSLFDDVKISYVAPDQLQMPKGLRSKLEAAGVEQSRYSRLGKKLLGDVDVLYVTRIQKERFEGKKAQNEYEKLKHYFVIDSKVMARAKDDMILMHPLPRVGEITEAVDDDKRASYFKQMRNGFFVRMALAAAVLERPFTVSAVRDEMRVQSGKMV